MDDKKLTATATAIAVVVIVAWLGILGFMISHVGDEAETAWIRLTVVLNSVEAIAFAAAGAMFGATVQKQRVKDAKERADKHEDAAVKGKALAHAIRARAKSAGLTGVGSQPHIAASGVPTDIAAMADELFP